jgi:hypothetical protein
MKKNTKRLVDDEHVPITASEQQSLGAFFGEQKPRSHGTCLHQSLQDNTSIYSWNLNGLASALEKGTLQAFIKEFEPTILCLNETKCD